MAKKKIDLKIKQADGSFEHLIPRTDMDAVMDVNGEKTLTEVLENDYATKQYVDDNKFSGDYNDLENRPCYDTRVFTLFESNEDFDGDLTDKVVVEPDSEGATEGYSSYKAVKISDTPPVIEYTNQDDLDRLVANKNLKATYTVRNLYFNQTEVYKNCKFWCVDANSICLASNNGSNDIFFVYNTTTVADGSTSYTLTPGVWYIYYSDGDGFITYPVSYSVEYGPGDFKQLNYDYISYMPGKSVEGQTFNTYNYTDKIWEDTIAKKGAEIFNNEENVATGEYSHAEGSWTNATGYASHSEGDWTTAAGKYSHAEGSNTYSLSFASHTEGYMTVAQGDNSHAEGRSCEAYGEDSHAEGCCTKTYGERSHTEGGYTEALSNDQHVEGRWNIKDSANKYIHIAGNGTRSGRSNAHTLDWNGNAWFQGNVSVDGTPTNDKDLTTKKYVDESVANLVNSAPETLDTLNELATALGNDENFATNITNNISNKVNKPEVNGTEGQVLSLDGQGNTVWADAGIDEDELDNMLTDVFGFSENE